VTTTTSARSLSWSFWRLVPELELHIIGIFLNLPLPLCDFELVFTINGVSPFTDWGFHDWKPHLDIVINRGIGFRPARCAAAAAADKHRYSLITFLYSFGMSKPLDLR
jgi:hypothetical protein